MKAFKYSLDKSSKKYICPDCNKKTFVRYKNLEGDLIDDKYGRCDREVNCAYFLKPEDDKPVFVPYVKSQPKPISFIPDTYPPSTFKDYDINNFTIWLVSLFGEKKVSELISLYRFGVDDSGPYTKDWTVFWQYDIQNRIRSGKMIKYGPNGHRDKDHSATWYHKKFRSNKPVFPDFNLRQCLFGEHLLNNNYKPVAIVESEKTAIIASVFLDKYVWLACGGKVELRREKVSVLKNRSVTIFPDLGAFGDWTEKAREFGFSVSDHIEKIATKEDRDKGLDLADFLLK